MFCINCGKQLEDGTRFCPYCGTSLTGEPPKTPEADGSTPTPRSKNADFHDDLKGSLYAGQTPASTPRMGADPWAMPGDYGAPKSGSADPWSGSGSVTATPAKQKKHTALIVVLIVLGVLVLGVIGLGVLGASLNDYEPVVESYFSYAAEGSAQRVSGLFHPDVYDYYVERYGSGDALEYADSWTANYGKAVDRYEISDSASQSGSLEDFNASFDLTADDYVDVTVNVFYEDGSYNCIDFDLVEVDDSWYLVDTW